MNNQLATQRQPITRAELEALTQPVLDAWTQGKLSFSAYSVTLELRPANPTLEIDHDVVREVVGSQMHTMISVDMLLYRAVTDDRFGQTARVYEPGNIIQAGGNVVRAVAKRLNIPAAPWTLGTGNDSDD